MKIKHSTLVYIAETEHDSLLSNLQELETFLYRSPRYLG